MFWVDDSFAWSLVSGAYPGTLPLPPAMVVLRPKVEGADILLSSYLIAPVLDERNCFAVFEPRLR